MFNKIIKYSLMLAFVTGFCSFLVLSVDSVTSPFLAKRADAELNESLSGLYDDIESYEVIKEEGDFSDGILKGLYQIERTSGDVMYAYYGEAVGKNSTGIKMFSIYDQEGTLDKIEIVEQSETPNIGDVIATDEYQEQFIGQTAGENNVDTISGATMSTSAVNEVVDLSGENFVQGGN